MIKILVITILLFPIQQAYAGERIDVIKNKPTAQSTGFIVDAKERVYPSVL